MPVNNTKRSHSEVVRTDSGAFTSDNDCLNNMETLNDMIKLIRGKCYRQIAYSQDGKCGPNGLCRPDAENGSSQQSNRKSGSNADNANVGNSALRRLRKLFHGESK